MLLNNKFDYSPITRETINGKRHYCLPNGDKVASVTTILDKTKSEESRKALQNWKDWMGPQRAQAVTTEAANRGTRMHTYLENFIKDGMLKDLPSNPFAQPSWFMAAEIILNGLDHVDEAWGVEVPVYYPGLYAGTTDCVGVWKGKPAIIDFKQTNKPKKEKWLDDYYCQLTAYALAHNETHGTDIKTGAILMCVKPNEKDADPKPVYQEFVLEGDKFDHYAEQWMERVQKYYDIA
jgi:genome maintenance exonuclease 1